MIKFNYRTGGEVIGRKLGKALDAGGKIVEKNPKKATGAAAALGVAGVADVAHNAGRNDNPDIVATAMELLQANGEEERAQMLASLKPNEQRRFAVQIIKQFEEQRINSPEAVADTVAF